MNIVFPRDSVKIIFFGISIVILLCAIALGVSEAYKITFILILFPVMLYVGAKFPDNYLRFFLVSLFIGTYFQWSFRLQVSLVFVLLNVFFFLIGSKYGNFNNLVLQGSIKFIAICLIISVFLSSIISPHASVYSVYYAFIFFISVFNGYVAFRSVYTTADIDRLLNSFIFLNFLHSIIIIIQILYTGNLRSVGPAGYFVIDFLVIALLFLIFRDFLLSDPKKNKILILLVILVTLITTASRFAWLGFGLTLVYGVTVSLIFLPEARASLKKNFLIYLFIILVTVFFAILFRLHDIILSRISSDSIGFFENPEGKIISNSLETRFLIWIVAINTFLHNPVFGVGYLMFSEVSYDYNNLPELLFNIAVKGLDAHTTYMNFLCETGVVGLTLFVCYVVCSFLLSFRAIKMSPDIDKKRVSIMLNVYIFFVMIHSIYSGAFTLGTSAFLMHFIFGFAIANYMLLKRLYVQGCSRSTFIVK